jgi:hypothetical protein
MEKQIKQIKNGIKGLLKEVGKYVYDAKKIVSVCNIINSSWSGSDLVGHADFFYGDFDNPPYNRRFSIEWGLIHGVPFGWHERSDDEILKKIENDSGVSVKDIDKNANLIADDFDKLRKQVIIAFSSISKEASSEIEKFNLQTKNEIFNQYWSRQIATRDSEAMYAGRKIPTHKYYWAAATFIVGVSEQINEFLYLVDKVFAQNKGFKQQTIKGDTSRTVYLEKNTLLRLKKIESPDFDLSRLISFCKELDDNYSLENYHSCGMLLRAILDHIPPIFSKTSFADVCSQYGGKSFKEIIRPLNETAKKIGDDYLHTQINKKVLAVTKTQVSFQANLDMLLNEIAAILEKEK